MSSSFASRLPRVMPGESGACAASPAPSAVPLTGAAKIQAEWKSLRRMLYVLTVFVSITATVTHGGLFDCYISVAAQSAGEHDTNRAVGILESTRGVASMVAGLLMGIACDRVGCGRIVRFSGLLTLLCTATVIAGVFTNSHPVVALGVAMHGVSTAAWGVALTALITQAAPSAEARTKAIAVSASVASFSFMCGPLIQAAAIQISAVITSREAAPTPAPFAPAPFAPAPGMLSPIPDTNNAVIPGSKPVWNMPVLQIAIAIGGLFALAFAALTFSPIIMRSGMSLAERKKQNGGASASATPSSASASSEAAQMRAQESEVSICDASMCTTAASSAVEDGTLRSSLLLVDASIDADRSPWSSLQCEEDSDAKEAHIAGAVVHSEAAFNDKLMCCGIRQQTLIPLVLQVSALIIAIGSGLTFRFWPLFYKEDMGFAPTIVCLCMAFNWASIGVGKLVAAPLARKIGTPGAILVGYFFGISLLVVISTVPTFGAEVLLVGLRNSFIGLPGVLVMSLVMGNAPPRHRGVFASLVSIEQSTWNATAILGGLVADRWSHSTAFLLTCAVHTAAICVMLFPLSIVLRRTRLVERTRRRAKAELDGLSAWELRDVLGTAKPPRAAKVV